MAPGQDPSTGPGLNAGEQTGLDEMALVRQVVEKLLQGIGLRVRLELTSDTDACYVDLQAGRSASLLTSRQGQVLNAIQYLTRAITHRRFPSGRYIYVDLAGVRAERKAFLRSKTEAIARLVSETGREMSLDLVIPSELRAVREVLRAFPALRVHTLETDEEERRNAIIGPRRR